MNRATVAIPRLAACAVCLTAVVAQQRLRPAAYAVDAELTYPTHAARQKFAVPDSWSSCSCTAASAPVVKPMLEAGSGWSSNALIRTVVQVLCNAWISLALGAAASWSTVQAKMVSTLALMKVSANAQAAEGPILDLATVQQFCGKWKKVPGQSESMDGFCELFGVPKWLRRAARLMVGLDIYLVGNSLAVKQVCKLGWLSVTETFPLDGRHSTPQRRRDMRPGKQVGQLLEACHSRMKVHVCWQGALAGSALDELQLQETSLGPVLVVCHKAHVEARGIAEFKEVFRLSS